MLLSYGATGMLSGYASELWSHKNAFLVHRRVQSINISLEPVLTVKPHHSTGYMRGLAECSWTIRPGSPELHLRAT